MSHIHNSTYSYKQYLPLIYVVSGILVNSFIIYFIHINLNLAAIIMGEFFLVFSIFKLLNLKGFVDAYQTYDILAKRLRVYGFIYPFLELTLGLLYLFLGANLYVNLFTLALMGFSSIGVIKTLRENKKFKCACLGAFFDIPVSNITLIEDLSMVTMALFMIFI